MIASQPMTPAPSTTRTTQAVLLVTLDSSKGPTTLTSSIGEKEV
jgi:hypothetical protein